MEGSTAGAAQSATGRADAETAGEAATETGDEAATRATYEVAGGAVLLEVSASAGIAVITVDRPGARNAISLETMDALDTALDAAASASVLVIRGGGDRAFVSGGDLKDLARIRNFEGAVAMATRMRRLCDRLATFPAPVVAALNGHAFGGGAEVCVAADIRVAVADATIAFNQAKLAIMPAWGGAERLAGLVGRSQALLLATTGERVGAPEALRIGLLDRVYPRESFGSSWRSLAAAIAASPSREIKKVIAAAAPHHHPSLEHAATAEFASLWITDAHWQAADAATRRPNEKALSRSRSEPRGGIADGALGDAGRKTALDRSRPRSGCLLTD
jgi:enoyl-CoA hydratase/carnithine racemase